MMKRFTATIIQGHRVASGLNGNPAFPGGTLRMQAPFFKARGLDLAPYYPGTLNVAIAPFRYRVVHAPWTFPLVKWHPVDPAETFSFFHVWRVLTAAGLRASSTIRTPRRSRSTSSPTTCWSFCSRRWTTSPTARS